MRPWLAVALLITAAGMACAQPRPVPAPAPPASTAPAPPPEPQQTTASFADWILRCTRTAPGAQVCEVVQGVSREDRTIAQVAIGRVAKGQPLHMTILVPISVSFGSAPGLAGGRDSDPAFLELAWRRCLPGGCLADATLGDDALHRIRALTDPARVVFTDGTGRAVALPFSPRGLVQALDALGQQDG